MYCRNCREEIELCCINCNEPYNLSETETDNTKITIPKIKLDNFILKIEKIMKKYGTYLKYSEGNFQELFKEIITDLTEINREIVKIEEGGVS